MITTERFFPKDVLTYCDETPWDEYGDYDPHQFEDSYEFYKMRDLAYFDAIVVVDRRLNEVVAIRSMVLDMGDATEILKNEKILK